MALIELVIHLKNFMQNTRFNMTNIEYKDLVKFVLNNKQIVKLVLSLDERDKLKLLQLIKEDTESNNNSIFNDIRSLQHD